MATKVCTVCRFEKPATDKYFSPHATGKLGFHPRCKVCRAKQAKEYYENHKDKHRELVDKYRDLNREKLLAYQREYARRRREQERENKRGA